MGRFLAMCGALCALFGSWEEHLRPCEGKRDVQSIEGVDWIYLINLEQRPDKWQRALGQLKRYGVQPYRFDAINGWRLFARNFSHVQQRPFSRLMNPGRIGCLLSHLSVLRDAYEAGYQTIWIMEDDIDVRCDPHVFSRIIRELDRDCPHWDLLYTDVETRDRVGRRTPPKRCLARPDSSLCPLADYHKRRPINRDCEEVRMRFGCYSMILRRSGVAKILQFFADKGLFFPLDNELPHMKNLLQVNLLWDGVTHLAGQRSNTQQSEERYRYLQRKLEGRF